MTTLTILIGLQASGKSTWAKENAESHEAVIVSSDSVRAENYGSEEIQGDNQKLFAEIHAKIISLLNDGTNVFFDATNISYKHRVELLKKTPSVVYKVALVFATPFHKCVEWDMKRERTVGLDVIMRYWKSFTMPQYNEGFDEIDIIYLAGFNETQYTLESFLSRADVFDQDNYHHKHSLGVHCRKVGDTCSKQNDALRWAGILHDNGKEYTKSRFNMKGEEDTISHYFGHENVGAYEAMFYLKNSGFTIETIVHICSIINFHMRPYFIKSEKAYRKFLALIGEELYADIMIVHEADKISH